MRTLASGFLAALALCLLVTTQAWAQQPQKSPFGVPLPAQSSPAPEAPSNAAPLGVRPATGEPGATAGPLARVWNWIFTKQSALNRDMAASVKNLKGENPLAAALLLIAIAFGYGVLHAAGPGHGKSVISAYVLTNKETVRRGIALSFLSAFFQAVSAILFVAIMVMVFRQTSLQMRATEATIETVSWGLVAAVGAFLLWRQAAPLLPANKLNDRSNHPGDTHHNHGPDCSCGHAHMPTPAQLQGQWSWRKALPLALSIGVRPCSGALLLLIFALNQGLLWAGVLGTFAMALGTAITVSALAALAVGSRQWATRATGETSVWAQRLERAVGWTGAMLVFALGVVFFINSLNAPSPL